jgi:hypothetical protein
MDLEDAATRHATSPLTYPRIIQPGESSCSPPDQAALKVLDSQIRDLEPTGHQSDALDELKAIQVHESVKDLADAVSKIQLLHPAAHRIVASAKLKSVVVVPERSGEPADPCINVTLHEIRSCMSSL